MTVLLLSILAPVGSANAATQTITFNKSITENNLTIAVSGTITIDTAARNVTGTITITVVNDTSGQTIFSRTIHFTNIFTSNNAGWFVQTIWTPYETMAASCTSVGCMVTKTPDLNHDGRVDIFDVAAIAFAYGSQAGSATWNSAADLTGNGRVDIMDVATVAADYGAPVA